jgi:hypothetical protein
LKTSAISVRIPKKEKELLQKYCKATSQDLSDFVRKSLLVRMAKLRLLNSERTKIILNYEEDLEEDCE